MYYAKRKLQIAADLTENQLLKFYTKKDRDTFINENGGESIGAIDAKQLTVDVWRGYITPGVGVFFVTHIYTNRLETVY